MRTNDWREDRRRLKEMSKGDPQLVTVWVGVRGDFKIDGREWTRLLIQVKAKVTQRESD